MSAVYLPICRLELSSGALTRYPYLSAPTYLHGVRSTETLNRISSLHASLGPPSLKHFAACLLVPHSRLAHANAPLPLPMVHFGHALTSPPFKPAGWTPCEADQSQTVAKSMWFIIIISSSSSSSRMPDPSIGPGWPR
ncbi:hypothetical protein CFIO01_09628 [Colletotrichum fioriniae PJ7]|uniref:Uncharacterized protein n=1 Tax=Colletotrichum fioriniae PJ7 TaxID=1445577 RepID=A0A010QXW7_9PEZI|nr:hypothetical protein CFIO01_09628 [Colletotrichum fioriniae PJ7]